MTVQISFEQEYVFLGSIFTLNLVVRDSNGRLYDPEEHPDVLTDDSMPVAVFAIADDGTVAAAASLNQMATPVVLDGCLQFGRYRVEIDSTPLVAGRYLLRADIPWATGKVNAQKLLTVQDPGAPTP